ncbi:MAG: hypothetical protein IJJ00_06610 [Erysipelotrichaceae bacterium]|nr:hypothetical protein [Erysipelotrichaceae bacterium]
MAKMKMFWSGEFDQGWVDKFSEVFDVECLGDGTEVRVPRITNDDPELIRRLQGVDVYLCGYDTVTRNVLENCPNLKLILSVRDGPEENIDLQAANELGIPVVSANGRCSVSVAECTFFLMCNLARPIVQVTNKMRQDTWRTDNWNDFRAISKTGTELYYKRLGIVGLGRNGKHLARLASGFQMDVVAYDPYVSEEEMAKLGVTKMDLPELMKTSDYVVPQVRLSDATKGIITRELIFSMKPTACIINTARGLLMDYDALYDALEQNVIRAAALDVYEYEPNGHGEANSDHVNPRVYALSPDKLLCTAHMAGITQERVFHQCENLFNEYKEFLKGEFPGGYVTKKAHESEGWKDHGAKLFGSEK